MNTKSKLEQAAATADDELRRPTPHERYVADMAEKNKDVKPERYDVTNKNGRAMRVVYNWDGQPVSIPPGETKKNVLLHPNTATTLGKGDLDLVQVT